MYTTYVPFLYTSYLWYSYVYLRTLYQDQAIQHRKIWRSASGLKNKERNFPGRTDEKSLKMWISRSPGFNTGASKHEAEVPTARCDSHNKQLWFLSEHQPGYICNGVVVFSVTTRTKKFNTIANGKLQNAPTGFTMYADVYLSVPMYNSRTSKRFFIKFDISVFFLNL
jgi:hypothetical protein